VFDTLFVVVWNPGSDTCFARCWPASEAMTEVELIHGTKDGELAWVVYEATIGSRFRNAELHRVRDGRIVETQVFLAGPCLTRLPRVETSGTAGRIRSDKGGMRMCAITILSPRSHIFRA
jgi:hypothetical protein